MENAEELQNYTSNGARCGAEVVSPHPASAIPRHPEVREVATTVRTEPTVDIGRAFATVHALVQGFVGVVGVRVRHVSYEDCKSTMISVGTYRTELLVPDLRSTERVLQLP